MQLTAKERVELLEEKVELLEQLNSELLSRVELLIDTITSNHDKEMKYHKNTNAKTSRLYKKVELESSKWEVR